MKITMYSTQNCTNCQALAQHLDELGITYEDKMVDSDAEAKKELMSMGYLGVPLTVVNNVHIVGSNIKRFDSVYALELQKEKCATQIYSLEKIKEVTDEYRTLDVTSLTYDQTKELHKALWSYMFLSNNEYSYEIDFFEEYEMPEVANDDYLCQYVNNQKLSCKQCPINIIGAQCSDSELLLQWYNNHDIKAAAVIACIFDNEEEQAAEI